MSLAHKFLIISALSLAPSSVSAAEPAARNAKGIGIVFFVLVVLVSLAITYWSARRTKTADEFYRAGGKITGFQNGLAIAGDFMSAATLLGITGLVYMTGFDTIIYILAPLVGMSVIVFLIAEPFRELGRFTITDVVSFRLREQPIRIFSAIASLFVVVLYLVAQLVGAGALIQLLFGLPYIAAVFIIGFLMMIYVVFGGMTATTWVQITKAVILIFALTFMAGAVLARFDFNLTGMYRQVADAHPLGVSVFEPGGLLKDPISTLSLALALVFGFVGLPHVLMRLYTVPNAHEARRSVVYSAGIFGYVNVLIFFIIAFGAYALLADKPEYRDAAGGLLGGSNMVAMHLAEEIGGEAFLGFMAAVAFATILAVVAGLTIAGASAISHDLYAGAIKKGEVSEQAEVHVSKIATVGVSVFAMALAVLFEKQNIAFIASLVFAISASTTFPLLILALYWRGLTTRGAVIGGSLGLVVAVSLIVLGPAVWVGILGAGKPIFPYAYPGIVSIPISFAAIILISLLDKSEDAKISKEKFDRYLLS